MMNSAEAAVAMGKLTVAWALITVASFVQETVRPTSSSMTVDPVIITLIGGMVVTVISAIVTGIVTVITALRQGESSKKIDAVSARQIENATSLVAVAKDTEAIKGHVNSEKTAAEGVLALKLREIELLKESLTRSEQRAAMLAQAAIQRVREAPAEAVVPSARTEAAVQKLKKDW